MIKFSERLKQLRTEQNLTQSDLADILKVNQRSISNWEKGIRQPEFEMLEKLAIFFNVSADYLLGLED